jgi:hypothetical protein
MIEKLDSYESRVIDLATLADDLRGLVAASELPDEDVVDFWDHFQEIDMVLELRTEPWARRNQTHQTPDFERGSTRSGRGCRVCSKTRITGEPDPMTGTRGNVREHS